MSPARLSQSRYTGTSKLVHWLSSTKSTNKDEIFRRGAGDELQLAHPKALAAANP